MEIINKLIEKTKCSKKEGDKLKELLLYIYNKNPVVIDLYLYLLRESEKPDTLLISYSIQNMIINRFPIEYNHFCNKKKAEEYLTCTNGN